MAACRLPFFSEPVVAFKAEEASSAFGFTWQEVTTRVEAFSIDATDKILEVRNYTHDDTRESLTKCIQTSMNRLFLLHPGEFITKAEVWCTEDEITALKLHTTKRTTPWYGETKGWHVTLEAEEGFCINAFRGKGGPYGCSQFGVVFAPKEIADEGHSVPTPPMMPKAVVFDGDDSGDDSDDDDGSEDSGSSDDDGDGDEEECEAAFAFLTVNRAPRAIVVKTGESHVEGVRVVSTAEYNRIVSSPESFQYAPDEQWLMLAPSERIRAVGVEVVDKRLVSITFKTNLHTSHVFGPCRSDNFQWVVCDDHAESYVCGFAFDVDETDAVNRLAVLCTDPGLEAAVSQQASKAA